MHFDVRILTTSRSDLQLQHPETKSWLKLGHVIVTAIALASGGGAGAGGGAGGGAIAIVVLIGIAIVIGGVLIANQVVLFIMMMMIMIVLADLTVPALFEDLLNLLHLVVSEWRELFRARAR